MMKRILLIALRGVLLLILGVGVFTPAAHCAENKKVSDRMAALRNSIETQPPPAPKVRVEKCLQILQDEMNSPSTPAFGLGGGPMDTGYLQGVIMGSVCTFAQKGAVREEIRRLVAERLQFALLLDKPLGDRLTIILGYCGDKTVLAQLKTIIETHPDGFMRASAAWAVREMGDCPDIIPTLFKVLETDNYARIRFSGSKIQYDSKMMVYSPVRDAAASVLRRLGRPVAKGAEVIEAKYGVQAIEPMLYDKKGSVLLSNGVIDALGWIGGPEAESALQTFIDRKKGVAGMESLVDNATEALTKLRAKE